MMIEIYIAGKSRRLLQNAHTLKGTMVCPDKIGIALQTALFDVCKYTPRGSVLACLASEHF